jgi:hypothetical protein
MGYRLGSHGSPYYYRVLKKTFESLVEADEETKKEGKSTYPNYYKLVAIAVSNYLLTKLSPS